MNLKDIINVIICVSIVWLGCLLSIIIHELGHAIGYMLSAREEKGSWHIVAGRGKQILKTKRTRICAFPFNGYFYENSITHACGWTRCLPIHDNVSLRFTRQYVQYSPKLL